MGFQNFFATKLYADIGAADDVIQVETPPTVTSGRLVLEARNPTQREIIHFSGVSGNQLTGCLRGQGDTTAKSHLKNALVEMNVTAEDLSDALDVPNDIVTRFDETLSDFISSGLTWSQSSLLVGSMTAGIIYINGYRVSVSATSYTFPASKDTYVDVNVAGTLAYTPVANNAAAPALAADSIRLAKVVTNATAITSVVQSGIDSIGNPFKPTGAVTTSKIADGAVASAKLNWSGFVLDSNGSGAAKTGITTGTYTYYTGMPSITFTLDAPGKVYVDGTTFIQNGTTGTMDNFAAVHLDGTKIGNDRTFTGTGSGNGGNIALPCSSTVAAGTHTLDIRVLTTGTMTVFPIRSYLRVTIAVGA